MSGFYVCFLCELAGRPAGGRFTAPVGADGLERMEEHVREPHLAERQAGGSDSGRELVDVALTAVDGPFNDPHRSRWTDLDSRRPENVPFPQWAQEQTLRSHNQHGPWISAQDVVAGFENLLSAEAARQERMRRAQAEGWRAGEPGE